MANRFKIIRPGKNIKGNNNKLVKMISSKGMFNHEPSSITPEGSRYKMNEKIYLAEEDGKVYGEGKISHIEAFNCGNHEADGYVYDVDVDREICEDGSVDDYGMTSHSLLPEDFEMENFYSQEDYFMKFHKEPILPDFDAMPRMK